MSNRLTNIIVLTLLFFIFFIAVLSVKDDSLTMDELAHLPAGYSYLTQKDMRLNPEHPPLIKDLAGLPLLFFKNINFPYEAKEWKEDVNGQWGFGNKFLFKNNNPADQMIFWGRIPMILILIILGFYIFKASKEIFSQLYSPKIGNCVGLLALFFYSFSPTFLAHGRLVTTDVGAAAGAFIATYYFLKFLKKPSRLNLIKAGIALGIAELLKFSLILLFPFFGILILFWSILISNSFKKFLLYFSRYVGYYIFILILCFIIIWLVYLYHVWNYPVKKQISDASFNLSSFGSKIMADSVVWMADKPILRPLGQYFHGVLMVLQRAAGGHTTYFLGEISASGWKIYFPFVYLIKVPLPFHILTLIIIIYILWQARIFLNKAKEKILIKFLAEFFKKHFFELSFLIFIIIYWTTSLTSNLNIGVRHLLPVFPFTIILVSGTTALWINSLPRQKLKKNFLLILLLWQAYNIIAVYPHFLSYFNELVPKNKGYLYTVDSNLDWGQDLKRLNKWVEENNINKIYVDYFGGADAKYYLKEKFEPWWGKRNPDELPDKNYLAVSATFLQGGRGKPAPGFDQPHSYYLWLNKYTPIKKIGNSIFVYYIEK